MPVIEAQCASILVPHDHRHINHVSASQSAIPQADTWGVGPRQIADSERSISTARRCGARAQISNSGRFRQPGPAPATPPPIAAAARRGKLGPAQASHTNKSA
jgi:hypothetical protein